MEFCLKGVFETKVHCEEWNFNTEEGEALYIRSVAKPGTKIGKVFPNKMRLRKVLLKRAVDDPMIVQWRRFNFRPILSRFGKEFKGLLPVPEKAGRGCNNLNMESNGRALKQPVKEITAAEMLMIK
ncbi:hypothetical protein K7X08_033115 [Anisodus acutangulus]|uniref:Uncharacterized protein n=1 Tax=Anisodus acutangulus TaxID=402998 RepID=A0A9Q1RC92_9SOLA|nr:hypothetical protein K7X08_033115 [Anisodus acutangulus]